MASLEFIPLGASFQNQLKMREIAFKTNLKPEKPDSKPISLVFKVEEALKGKISGFVPHLPDVETSLVDLESSFFRLSWFRK